MKTSDSDQLEQQQYSSFPDFQHLNIDLCLELVCPYLDLNDLSSVADSCMQMKRAAELTFAHKYHKQLICIRDSERDSDIWQCRNYEANLCENKIILSKPKICFRVLRCFGRMISKLCCVECSTSTGAFWCYLDKYIGNHCTSYITQLEMLNRRTSCVNLEATFPNVEKLRFIRCKLNRTTTEFNKRYPQMRSLEFATASTFGIVTEVADRSCIVDHFPNLEHLSLDILSQTTEFENEILNRQPEHIFLEGTVLDALELNPKLRSLSLFSKHGDQERDFFQKVNKKCELLGDDLQLVGPSLQFSDVIHFENVKCFKFTNCRASLCKPIPLTFNALETFDSYSFARAALPFIFDFVRKNPSLSKMIFLISTRCLTRDKITEMTDAFATVKELEIHVLVLKNSAEKISRLLNGLKSLHKLILIPSFEYKFEYLLEMIKLLPQIPWIVDEKNKRINYNKVN